MTRERDLERRLREAQVPDEGAAEQRAWNVVRSAYAERTPLRRGWRRRRLVLALAAGAVLLAIGLSPAGAKVGDLVSDVIGQEDAKPTLRSLPAAGELLVESENGPWIVREDGSKRLLGDYGQATWSPRGVFVAATHGRELVTLDPLGNVRWTHPAPGRVSDPRWTGTEFDTRIAYRSGENLRVIAGDNTDDRLIARDVAPLPPVWRSPAPEAKVLPGTDRDQVHVLSYLDGDGDPQTVDADSRKLLPPTRRDVQALFASAPRQGAVRAISPGGGSQAIMRNLRGRAELILERTGRDREQLFAGPGRFTGPTWSPDGRWLLVGWRDADQWLFIRVDRPRRTVAFDNISRQFASGDNGEPRFPRVSGWVLPQR